VHETHTPAPQGSIHLPSPTAWPMVLALGVSLMVAGLITHVLITLLGLVLLVVATVGWFRNVLPHESHELVPVQPTAMERTVADALEPAAPARVNVASERTYSFLSGLEAGAAGGLAMALVATLYSLFRFHSLWYAVNLLAASSFVSWADASDVYLAEFHMEGLLVSLTLHILVSLLVGLLYGSIMPIFPRGSLLSGGLLTPLVWTGMAWALMASVAPVLGARVDWIWFILSQVAFGLTAVFVVNLRVRFRSASFQKIPFDQRAGLHRNLAHPLPDDEVKP